MSFFDFSILMSFYDKATVIGEGLSVTIFFKAVSVIGAFLAFLCLTKSSQIEILTSEGRISFICLLFMFPFAR